MDMSRDLHVVTSADDKFVIGLAGTIRSALSCLSSQRRLRLFVLDGGITAANKIALVNHWNDARLHVEWVSVDRTKVSEFVVSDHVSDATYYRLLAPELLPSGMGKFIFLDADLLVRRDLSVLWDEPMDGLPCLAVQDIGAPFVDSRIHIGTELAGRGALVVECPIPNYKQLGLSPSNPYFNGGVMVVDLALWRREHIARRMLDLLRTEHEHVLFWDQYALNVVLSGRWRPLSPLWNQNAIVYRYPGWLESEFCVRDYPTYATDPWIVHFNWLKPWHEDCIHPFADVFLRNLVGSPWEVSIERGTQVVVTPPRRQKLRKMEGFSRSLRESIRSGMHHLFRDRVA
jgi:lipopolysaccharide biosynthesis glycosyltransferase